MPGRAGDPPLPQAAQGVLVDGFAQCVVGNIQLTGYLRFGPALLEALLSLHDDFRGHHPSPANSTRLVKTSDAFLAILFDTPYHTTLGDPEGFDGLRLFAGTLDAQLCGEHAEGWLIALSMFENGLNAAEIEPFSILPHYADPITDAGSIFGNKWQ